MKNAFTETRIRLSLNGPLLKYVFLSLIVFEFLTLQSWAATYYVDIKTGNDVNSGMESEPFRSIKRASEVMEPGDKAVIREGVYHETIMGGKSGLPGKPVIYEGVDRDKVIMRGSVTVKDWRKVGSTWMKVGLKPVSPHLAFVMVDEKHLLKRVSEPRGMPEGSFCLDAMKVYYIRLPGDADPNTQHNVDVYELNLGMNAGTRWGGTSKKHIVVRNMTFEKYATYGISTAIDQRDQNSHWELDNLRMQYNQQCGVFACLDDWNVHDCLFARNKVLGCQINGARVTFRNNMCMENEYFGPGGYGGVGLIIGPDEAAHSCSVFNNSMERNGASDGYGCGIYLEGRSHSNVIRDNLIKGNLDSGVGFFGSSRNLVINNVIVDTGLTRRQGDIGAFFVGHSYEGAPTQSTGNIVAHNTVWKCATPIKAIQPSEPVPTDQKNIFVNNVFAEYLFLSPYPPNFGIETKSNAWFQTKTELKWTKESLKGMLDNRLGSSDETNRFQGQSPGFMSPDQGNFRLKKGAHLIDAAILMKEVSVDKDGVNRPCGKAPDIGAYEMCD